MEDFSLETTVVLYGVFHGIGGASVAINLGMMAYIGDIADESTKVSLFYLIGIEVFLTITTHFDNKSWLIGLSFKFEIKLQTSAMTKIFSDFVCIVFEFQYVGL
jgi:hypothetical protein